MAQGGPTPRFRNYRALLQRFGGLRAGRLGTSALLRTDRNAFPEVAAVFALLGGGGVALGLRFGIGWLWIIGGLVAVVGVLHLGWIAKSAGAYEEGEVRALRSGGPGGRQKRTFERIRAKDDAFDGAALLARVRAAYLRAHDAWNGRAVNKLRAFLSDGVYERFRLAAEELSALGAYPQLRQGQLVQCFVIHGYAEERFDVITMRIDVIGDAHQVDDAGRDVRLPIFTARYTEYWTLVRRAESRTATGQSGLLEGQCPRCGAAVEVNHSARCAHCDAALRNGSHDWVLVEVTQMGNWRSTDPGRIPGVKDLCVRDPGFSLACFEDHVAVVFWRLAEAARTRRTDGLGLAVSDELRTLYGERLRPGHTPVEFRRSRQATVADGTYQYVAQRVVEAVDTLGVAVRDGRQLAVVRVRFVGRVASQRDTGPPSMGEDYAGETLMVFARPADATTALEDGLDTAHCRACGGSLGSAAVCGYCDTPVAPEAHDWILTATSHVSPPGVEIHGLIQSMAGPPPRDARPPQ